MFGHQDGGGVRYRNLPGIVGFGVAAEQTAQTWRAEAARIQALRDGFERQLMQRLPDVRINAKQTARLPNTSNFAFAMSTPRSFSIASTRPGSALPAARPARQAASEPSHVLSAMGHSPEAALAALRFSFGSGKYQC